MCMYALAVLFSFHCTFWIDHTKLMIQATLYLQRVTDLFLFDISEYFEFDCFKM